MARIYYSMAGEGRGHAVRVRTLVEHLRYDHELVLFAPDEAYEFLARFYGPPHRVDNVQLMRIPGIKFHYTGGKLDLFKSVGFALSYARGDLPTVVRAMTRRMEAEPPDLCISDFEPALPRAARLAQVPLLTIDHQHVLLAYDLRSLPLLLRRYAWWMSWSVRWYYGYGPYEAVASSFYSPPLKPGFGHVRQVGPMLRADLLGQTPGLEPFLLSYLRGNTPPRVVEMLAACGRPVRIYGLGERPPQGQVSFHAIDEHRFVEDLSHCAALVSAAGNQLLGEALYFGKPVFAIPEQMHHEQQINACFLRLLGAGDWTPLEAVQARHLTAFLDGMETYRVQTAAMAGRLNGTADALAAIRASLNRRSRPSDLASTMSER